MGPLDPRRVASREDLVAFVRSLEGDLTRNPERWENVELGRYLEAIRGMV
jgi:hypothetical protein